MYSWENFHGYKWPGIEQIIQPFGHTGTIIIILSWRRRLKVKKILAPLMGKNILNVISHFLYLSQCDHIWQNFTTFGKSLQVFGKILTVYFLFGKMMSLLWKICDIIGLIFHVATVQILKNNLTIWSHWSLTFHLGSFWTSLQWKIFFINTLKSLFTTLGNCTDRKIAQSTAAATKVP